MALIKGSSRTEWFRKGVVKVQKGILIHADTFLGFGRGGKPSLRNGKYTNYVFWV